MNLFLQIGLLAAAVASFVQGGTLESEFLNPPDAARPGVYWYFMDGNQDRDEMIADLHAMKDVGIGSVLFLEVNLGMPRGPVPFMSEAWQDNVAHAFVEAEKLGMEVILGTGPGWSGSGGSWVQIRDSMQHLVESSVQVKGPQQLDRMLTVPPPHRPGEHSGMNAQHEAERNEWFNDVAVLAFPTPSGTAAMVDEVGPKTWTHVPPYTLDHTRLEIYIPRADYPEPDPSQVIDLGKVVDLTSKMEANGRIRWDMPAGEWTIMRFVARATGQTTRPAPLTGHGFATNTFDGDSFQRHWDAFQAKLLKKVRAGGGSLTPGKGVTTVHLDSWEMGSQNWTAKFRAEFEKRRGYDPQPYYPAWMGRVVGSREKTERFLWDLRKTCQDLVLDEHVGKIKKIAHDNGFQYSNEPYGMNPASDLDLGSIADIPMCEFWSNVYDAQYSCIEAVSIANTMGRRIVKAESFTTGRDAFKRNPAKMKNLTDWAFAIGINGILFHTYQHQALGNTVQPGMTMGRYGIHWHRNQTFWNFLPGYHQYIARCSHLLRQGQAVSDILYLTPEEAPYVFEAPEDATEGPATMRDKKGYAFDAVSPRILAMRATVENGRIAFPNGTHYRVLVLPNAETMTPKTLGVIERLVKNGGTVIGNPPVKSPSLVNFPACDAEVMATAKAIWGSFEAPKEVSRIDYGSGTIFWGGDLAPHSACHPNYHAVAALLEEMGLPQDFTSPSGKLRYKHRRTKAEDIYFVSNREDERVDTEGLFRVQGRQPQLWDPVTGKTRAMRDYQTSEGITRIPLSFEPHQSFFVVFSSASESHPRAEKPAANFPSFTNIAEINGPWNVSFDPARGGPEKVDLDRLIDWTQHSNPGMRYYSGTATYRKTFDLPGSVPAHRSKIHLDLGTVHDLCRVRLNGRDVGVVWTAPWRVDITQAVRAADNQLEIEVVNGWVNRLIGDQQPENKGVRELFWPSGLLEGKTFAAGRYTFVTHEHYRASSPLLPAGLLGPVSILTTNP